MLTPTELEERQKVKDREKEIETIAGGCVCSVCGAGLIAPWDPATSQIELRCSRDKPHVGHVRLDRELDRLMGMRQGIVDRGGDTEIIDAEIRTYQAKKTTRSGKNMVNETALQEYRQGGLMTADLAREIISTIPGWSVAPANVVTKAVCLCRDYRLYPGQHVFLIPFKSKKTGNTTWAVVFGIGATRLLASRRKAISYVDGPRVAGDGEAKEHFQDQFDANMLYAKCVVGGVDGSRAEGWGTWPRDVDPQGTDKGNSAANMAEIRAERKALSRLCPGEMPSGVDVVDESYLNGRPSDVAIESIDEATGEIIEGEAIEVNGTVSTDTATEKPAFVKPKDDPSEYTPRDFNDLCGACKHYYDKEANEVEEACKELTGKKPSTKQEVADCWVALVGSWEDAKEKQTLF